MALPLFLINYEFSGIWISAIIFNFDNVSIGCDIEFKILNCQVMNESALRFCQIKFRSGHLIPGF